MKTGGLVLAAKPGDLRMWQGLARRVGRSADMMVFSPEHPLRFNFIADEMKRGGSTRSITQLITTIGESLRSADSDGREDGNFWQMAQQRTIHTTVEVVKHATGSVSAPDLQQFIATAATSGDMLSMTSWVEGFHHQCLKKATAKSLTAIEEHDLGLAFDFWIKEFPFMADKTRSSILAGVMNILHTFNTGLVRELVSGETNVSPDDLLKGNWLLVNMPPAAYGDEGLLVAAGWKYLLQRAVLRRDPKPGDAPVGIWCDEFHLFCNRFDSAYLAQCRSHMGFMCALTQGVSSLYGQLRGEAGKHQADALLGNFAHAIVHACDPVTAGWASSKLGKSLQTFVGSSLAPPKDLWQDMIGRQHVTANASEHYSEVLQPNAFMNGLRTGGPECGNVCDAIVIRTGMPFSTGHNWLWVPFTQG